MAWHVLQWPNWRPQLVSLSLSLLLPARQTAENGWTRLWELNPREDAVLLCHDEPTFRNGLGCCAVLCCAAVSGACRSLTSPTPTVCLSWAGYAPSPTFLPSPPIPNRLLSSLSAFGCCPPLSPNKVLSSSNPLHTTKSTQSYTRLPILFPYSRSPLAWPLCVFPHLSASSVLRHHITARRVPTHKSSHHEGLPAHGPRGRHCDSYLACCSSE